MFYLILSKVRLSEKVSKISSQASKKNEFESLAGLIHKVALSVCHVCVCAVQDCLCKDMCISLQRLIDLFSIPFTCVN